MATITINATDTTGTSRATTLAAIITAIQGGKIRTRGNKKYVRISDRLLDMSTADVNTCDFTDTAGNTKTASISTIIATAEAGSIVLSGNKTYLRIGNSLCDQSTSTNPL